MLTMLQQWVWKKFFFFFFFFFFINTKTMVSVQLTRYPYDQASPRRRPQVNS